MSRSGMAQSPLPRRRSWTAGAGVRSVSASSQWVRNEQYRELKELEQEAKRSMKEMKLLEIDIREQSAGLEKLEKRDAQRVAKILDLSRVLEAGGIEEKEGENETEGDGEEGIETKPTSEDLQEELERLKQDHTGIQSTMGEMKMSLENKRNDLERLAAQHKGLCEQIVQEEKALQAAELEESLQQSVAVHHEMRSLSEDLRRLGDLMEDFSPNSISDSLKQNPVKPQKVRGFHRDIRRGTRSVARTSHEGVRSLEHGWFSLGERDLPSSSRAKEPVEFEEREGSNRKRHKNSSFEQELDRLHEEREKLEIEAHEKQMLLESVARFSSDSRGNNSGLGMSSRKGNASSQPILSPSSVFEGFQDTPSIGPARPASTESSSESSDVSVSSDVSSEESTVQMPEEGVGSSTVKRLNFAHSSSSKLSSTMLQHIDTGESCISMEDISEYGDDVSKDQFGSVALEGGSVGSYSDNVKEHALTTGNGLNEECSADEVEIEDFSPQLESAVEVLQEEDLLTESGIDEIDKLEEEVGSWEDGVPQDIFFEEGGGADEHHAPLSHRSYEKAIRDVSEEQRLSGDKIRQSGMVLHSSSGESGEEATASSVHPVSRSPQGNHATDAANEGENLQITQDEDDIQAGEASATNEGVDESRSWRDNAENQINKLSSQLNLLQQKVDLEVTLQDEIKMQEDLEQSSATTNQLSKQVSCFGDEITELRQNMLQLQQKLLKEVESRSVAEESVQNFHNICVDQSAKLEHLGTQVSNLARDLDEQLKLRAELEVKLEREAQERLKVEAELKDLSQAVSLTAISKGTGDEALGQLIEQQKTLLVKQLKEAEKLRTVAEVRVLTLDKQVEQLESVFVVSQNVQDVWKFQDKILKLGLQTLFQVLMLALCVSTLYSRVADAIKSSLIPT